MSVVLNARFTTTFITISSHERHTAFHLILFFTAAFSVISTLQEPPAAVARAQCTGAATEQTPLSHAYRPPQAERQTQQRSRKNSWLPQQPVSGHESRQSANAQPRHIISPNTMLPRHARHGQYCSTYEFLLEYKAGIIRIMPSGPSSTVSLHTLSHSLLYRMNRINTINCCVNYYCHTSPNIWIIHLPLTRSFSHRIRQYIRIIQNVIVIVRQPETSGSSPATPLPLRLSPPVIRSVDTGRTPIRHHGHRHPSRRRIQLHAVTLIYVINLLLPEQHHNNITATPLPRPLQPAW
jgi:hypothetical protein